MLGKVLLVHRWVGCFFFLLYLVSSVSLSVLTVKGK